MVANSIQLVRPSFMTYATTAPNLDIYGNLFMPDGTKTHVSIGWSHRLYGGYNYTASVISDHHIVLSLLPGKRWAEIPSDSAYVDICVSSLLIEEGSALLELGTAICVARIVPDPTMTVAHTLIHPTAPTLTVHGTGLDADDLQLTFNTGLQLGSEYTVQSASATHLPVSRAWGGGMQE